MALKLITETVQEVQTLVEQPEGKEPTYFITGIFMQGNIKNQNGRVYPTQTLSREMERYQRDYIEKNRAFGELGHPDNPTVNLERASHMITSMKQEGNNFIGKAKIIETPMGRIVKTLMKEGGMLGVSTRGLGSVQETEFGMQVQEDFYLATVDIVADPSAPDAFVRGIMEGKAWVWESGALKECALEQLAQKIDEAHAPTVRSNVRTETFVESYKQFLTALRRGVSSNIR